MRFLFLTLLALAACQGSGSRGAGSASAVVRIERFPSFPAEAVADDVVVEARFYRDHATLLGVDLAKVSGVVPIALRVGLALDARSKVRFAPEEAGLKLVLADGTVLASVPVSTISTHSKRGTSRATRAAAEAAWLVEWNRAADEFVYFALEPEGELHVRGVEVAHKTGDIVRTLDLDRSLVAFDVEIDGERAPVRVGVKLDNASKKR